MDHEPMDHDPTLEPLIRARARALWEREGRPELRHIAHWRQASREIAAERAGRGDGSGAPVREG